LRVAQQSALADNLTVDLNADYRPEFESFKGWLLDLARIRPVDELLKQVVTRLSERPHVSLARVWLLGKGDQCAVCSWRNQCPDQKVCLHLRASAGRSLLSPGSDWSHCNGEFRRIPLGLGNVGAIGATAQSRVIQDVAGNYASFLRPAWAQTEGIRGFNGHPIVYNGEMLGVLAVFTRIPTPDQAPTWVRILADYIAVAIVNARAFEEIEHLRTQLELENRYLREEVREAKDFAGILGQSTAWRELLRQIQKVAPTDTTVLIQGESGTGKELVAREIHRLSQRQNRPLIRVNCASIPRDLYESEFFGHAKGAFTGALKDRAGRFEAADGGTLFLDEVAEIPLELQSKLLRVLQEGQYERVGEEKSRSVNVRIIAATNRRLDEAVAEGHFRQDLFYRLNVFPIEVAPLRERKTDIPVLATHFVDQAARRLKLKTPRLTEDHVKQLCAYDWPGNVRELQNVIERALILAQDEPLKFHLPARRSPAPALAPTHPEPAPTEVKVLTEAELFQREHANTLAALTKTNWKIHGPGGAAHLLGVKPSTLLARIKKLGLKRPY